MLNVLIGTILFFAGAHFLSAPFSFGIAVTVGLAKDLCHEEQGACAAQFLFGAAVPYVYLVLGGMK